MAPAPMITTEEGSESRTRAWSLVMIRSPTSRPGSILGYDPVARTTSLARIVLPSTWTAGPAASFPVPRITSILRALISPVSPETFFSTMWRSASTTFGQSTWPDALMPHSCERLIRSMTAADSRSAFEGMHPRSRHVPPSRSSRSTMATRLPSSAARRAVAYPPVPLPRTTTS